MLVIMVVLEMPNIFWGGTWCKKFENHCFKWLMASNLTIWMPGTYIFQKKIQNKITIFNLTHLWKLSTQSQWNSDLPSCLLKSWCSPLIMGFTRPLSLFPERSISSFPELWKHQISHQRSITAHTNTCTEPKEAGRCGTLLVGRAEPLWRSPWRSKVVSATLLRWRETQKRGGGLIISADDKEVNHFSGQTATHNITTCIRSKTNNYIKPELNGKSNKSSGPQPHEHPETFVSVYEHWRQSVTRWHSKQATWMSRTPQSKDTPAQCLNKITVNYKITRLPCSTAVKQLFPVLCFQM